MNLHDDLLKQAKQLALLDAKKPKQVNLRRAVSSAYYALFHLLVSDAAGLYATEFKLTARIGRGFKHEEMKKASVYFAADKYPRAIHPGGKYTTPEDLRVVAETFFLLQQARHDADYDLTREPFTRVETLDVVRQVEAAFAAWERVRKSDDARIYLACFLLWKHWDHDPPLTNGPARRLTSLLRLRVRPRVGQATFRRQSGVAVRGHPGVEVGAEADDLW